MMGFDINVRPTWDDYFMLIAQGVSLRSTCSRRSVGAVFVSADNHILSTGYNGAPSGERHCCHTPEWVLGSPDGSTVVPSGDIKIVNGKTQCSVVIHAELNAVLAAAKKGIALQGSKLYVTYRPCEECSKFLKQLNLERIVCPELKITSQ